MKQFDLLIIGFGKAGKTLAKTAATNGKTVAVIEQSKKCTEELASISGASLLKY